MQFETKFNPGDKVKIAYPHNDSNLTEQHTGLIDTISNIQLGDDGFVYHLHDTDLFVKEDALDLASPPTKIFVCDKCGKVITYRTDDWDWHKEECHHISLGRPGYGSGLDGCDVDFNLCDDCLIALIDSFTVEGQERVLNSGSNAYLSSEDWIKLHKGEMSDEEMEEHGFMSNRQRQAYRERFPVCDKVYIKEYSDGSRASKCPSGCGGDANGDIDKLNEHLRRQCFGCKKFAVRLEGFEFQVIRDDR